MVTSSKPSQKRFVPYDQLDSLPNIIVDGAGATGTVLTLSHWPKSGTPAELRRDTSTEIVFAYLDSQDRYPDPDLVSNNHFDEDGLAGILSLTNTLMAAKYRDLLMDVANAGDFGVFQRRDAARIVFALFAHADPNASPLPKDIFELPHLQMAGRLYEQLLEVLPRLFSNLNDYKHLWEREDAKLSASEKLIESGDITFEERPDLDLAVVCIPENILSKSGQTCLTECHPFAMHSRTKCSRLLIVQGQHIEFNYRYESWVQLASRRPPSRVDLKDLARELNLEETSGGSWIFDGVERITPRLHLAGSSVTSLSPTVIRKKLEQHLLTGAPAWNPYD